MKKKGDHTSADVARRTQARQWRTPPLARFPLVYPLVRKVQEPEAYNAGALAGSKPIGVVVHDTADRDLARLCRSLKQEGLGYHLIIDRDGKITQLCYLDRRANHAGEAMWGIHSPNRWFASVALVSWGKLQHVGTEFHSWSGAVVPAGDVIARPGLDGKPGLWDKATAAQEEQLIAVLRWFVINGVQPDQICGHDECARPKGRKVDPGGVLSMTMKEVRRAAVVLPGAYSLKP